MRKCFQRNTISYSKLQKFPICDLNLKPVPEDLLSLHTSCCDRHGQVTLSVGLETSIVVLFFQALCYFNISLGKMHVFIASTGPFQGQH